jgi:NAD(P)-dependent dehydrogenase (short-subunit alcohol dehydrogenase family)
MAHAVGIAGAKVVIWGRNEEKNAQAIVELHSRGIEAHSFECDVSDEASVEEAFRSSVTSVGGRIDSVFANAGRAGTNTSFIDTSLSQWRDVMATNLDGVFLTLRTAARHMIDKGGGSLVAVSSTSAIHGAAGNEAYGASKTALLGLVRALAVGLARHNIRVNSLLPGWTNTEMLEQAHKSEKFRAATVGRTPVRRWAEPSEIAPLAVFLADPTITFHTGDAIVFDGGYTIF